MFCHGHRRRCHVLSWSAAPPAPSPSVRIPHAVPPSRSVPLRSVRPRRSGRQAGPCFARIAPACARTRARDCAGAVCAPDCARAAGRTSSVITGRPLSLSVPPSSCPDPPAPAKAGDPGGRGMTGRGIAARGPLQRGVMECHVWSWSAGPPAPAPPVRIPHAVPPSHSVPFRSPRRRPDRPAGPCFARIAPACARTRARDCAGAVCAPDCARETADARLPSTHAGAFFGPSRSPAQKRQRRPRKPPSLYRHRTTRLPDVKPRNGHNMKLFRYFSGNRAGKPGFTRPRRCPATPRR